MENSWIPIVLLKFRRCLNLGLIRQQPPQALEAAFFDAFTRQVAFCLSVLKNDNLFLISSLFSSKRLKNRKSYSSFTRFERFFQAKSYFAGALNMFPSRISNIELSKMIVKFYLKKSTIQLNKCVGDGVGSKVINEGIV